jgi:hypothetical protein
MMMCNASVIDYLLVIDIFCCVMFICMTKKWNNLLLFGFAKLTKKMCYDYLYFAVT